MKRAGPVRLTRLGAWSAILRPTVGHEWVVDQLGHVEAVHDVRRTRIRSSGLVGERRADEHVWSTVSIHVAGPRDRGPGRVFRPSTGDPEARTEGSGQIDEGLAPPASTT